jgi:hypothetical protein
VSLVPFHRVLIGSAIIFCAGFSALELLAYARGGGMLELVLGLLFAAAAGAFIVYLWHLRRILGLPKQRPPHRLGKDRR